MVNCLRAGRERCLTRVSEQNGSYPPQVVVEVLVSDEPIAREVDSANRCGAETAGPLTFVTQELSQPQRTINL